MGNSIPNMIKKSRMLLSYHARNFGKRILIWPIILYVITLSLFLLVLTPNIVLHRLPIFGEWPRILECDGNVFIKTNINNCIRHSGLAKTIVEIGGYKAMTDQEGKFHIKFVSKSFTNIPILIQWSNNTVVKRISFGHNQFKRTEVFILNEQ